MTFKIDSVPSYVRERISREGTRPMSDLLDLALKAHGGLDRWREVKSVDARVSLTGALYHLNGYPAGFRADGDRAAPGERRNLAMPTREISIRCSDSQQLPGRRRADILLQ